MRRMNLEPIIQSEVSQKEENKYCVLTHIPGIYKDSTAEPICRAALETDIENRLVDTVGEGAGGKDGECSTETCTSPDAKWPVGICSYWCSGTT